MKKTIDLLEEVMDLGFTKEEALRKIDSSLDYELGFENRKNLDEEEIEEELYSNILFGFKCEAEGKEESNDMLKQAKKLYNDMFKLEEEENK